MPFFALHREKRNYQKFSASTRDFESSNFQMAFTDSDLQSNFDRSILTKLEQLMFVYVNQSQTLSVYGFQSNNTWIWWILIALQ